MNHAEDLIALDVGQRVRYHGYPCIVVGVSTKRMTRRDLDTGAWSCVGDRYFGVDLIDDTGHAMSARLEQLLTEEEYLETIKEGEQHGNQQ